MRICIPLAFFLLHLELNAQAPKFPSKNLTNSSESATPKESHPNSSSLVYGGTLGGYHRDPAYLQLNPMAGFRTNAWWMNGISINYAQIHIAEAKENMYGVGAWTRAYFSQSFFLQSEVEILRRDGYGRFGNDSNNSIAVWLVGGGYSIGGQLGFNAIFLFDLIRNPNTPYSNRIIRMGGLFTF
jgi:hypothetical protein